MKTIFKNLRADIQSGFIVFLIALPLSVGIAIASAAPPSSGLLAAIIGGILGSILGGGHININGPAAGLIVIVLNAVQTLGHGDNILGFKLTLACIVAAGVLQVLMGSLGLARYGLAFPSSVVHGMLTAIGIIIITKQTYIALGITSNSKNILFMLEEIPKNLLRLNPAVALISISTLLTLLLLQKSSHRVFKLIPASVFAITVGVYLGKYINLKNPHELHWGHWAISLNPSMLLNIPVHFTQTFISPNFTALKTWDGILVVISLTLVASLESTLSAFAVDKLDPKRRHSNLNRDLCSKGICNIICGLIGGLPIITEIVRSSANISSDARSQFSNFFHGVFMLIFVLALPWMLNEIPLSALAALLICVGWRLAHPSQFKHAYRIGQDHILAFLVTLTITLATDLLIGITAGIATEFAIALWMGVNIRDLFHLNAKVEETAHGLRIETLSPLVFSNSLRLRSKLLRQLSKEEGTQPQKIHLDLSHSHFIDHTVLDQIDSLSQEFKTKGIELVVIFSQDHRPLSEHELSSRRITI